MIAYPGMKNELKTGKNVYLIAAMSENRVIGIKNRLPWHMPADLENFRTITRGKPFIMGRNSYLSEDVLLSDYKSVILSHEKINLRVNCYRAGTIGEAFGLLEREDEIYILGGEQVFRQTLPLATGMYLTLIHAYVSGDAFFPEFDEQEWLRESLQFRRKDDLNPFDLTFMTYRRKA